MLPEKSQQSRRLTTDTLHGVFHKFGRYESEAALYFLIMFGYLRCQRVYGAVHGDGIGTAPIGTTFFWIPDIWIHRHFRAYLLPFGIYANFTE